MELTFIDPGFESMIDGIMAFQTEETTSFWTTPLFRFYPQLDQEYADSLCFSDRKDYIKSVLRAVYDEKKSVIDGKNRLVFTPLAGMQAADHRRLVQGVSM